MATAFPVTDIAELVRSKLSLPTYSGVTRITTARVLSSIQRSARSLSALSRQKQGTDNDFIATATLATQPGINIVSAPSNFGELQKILWVKSSTEVVPCQSAQVQDRLPLGFNPQAWDQVYSSNTQTIGPKYDIEGNTFTFYPCPSQVYTLAVWYTNHTVITSLADTVLGRLDWDKWIALDVAIDLCSDLKRDPSLYIGEKAQLEGNLFAAKRKKDTNAQYQIRDVGIYGDDW